jgi:hypothetical protein
MSDAPITDESVLVPPAGQPDLNLLIPPVSATEQTVPDGGVTGDTQSVISSLRDLRSKLGSQAPPLDIVVPGYDNVLLLRCKWVPLKTLSEAAQGLDKITEPTELHIAAAADTLVTTCQEFVIRVGKEIKPLSQDGVPITFGDPRLPELLGFAPVESARAAVRAVFANEYALIETGNAVVEWLKDTTKRVNADLQGN